MTDGGGADFVVDRNAPAALVIAHRRFSVKV
jgi:hypothetical protein